MKKNANTSVNATDIRNYRNGKAIGIIYSDYLTKVRVEFHSTRDAEREALKQDNLDYLFKRYSRIIAKWAHHYNEAFGFRLDERELISAGFIGLTKAVERYNSPRCAFTVDAVVRHNGKSEKCVFLPYAESGIRNAIKDEIARLYGYTGISRSGDWSKVKSVSYEEAILLGEADIDNCRDYWVDGSPISQLAAKATGNVARNFLRFCREFLKDDEFVIIREKVNGLTFEEIGFGFEVSKQAIAKRFGNILSKVFDHLLPKDWRSFSQRELRYQVYEAVKNL